MEMANYMPPAASLPLSNGQAVRYPPEASYLRERQRRPA
jgi:hypothetical protein